MLIPFYIFSHENAFPAYNSDGKRMEELKAEYHEILERLDGLEQQGKLGAFDKKTIVDLAGDVIEEIAQKYENVQRGIGGMMRGAMIETSARKLRNEAINETSKKMAAKLLKMGKLTVEEIAECSGLSVEEIEQLAGLQTV